jgi:hypothetical protein
MTNVMLERGKEIDLLAVNPISGEKYYIEVRVTIEKAFKLRLIGTQSARETQSLQIITETLRYAERTSKKE